MIRRYQDGDAPAICALYRETTRLINGRDYAPVQITRWVEYGLDEQDWAQRMSAIITYVAIADEVIVGFAELEPDGHVGYFYCHHRWQRKGVGSELFTAIAQSAIELKISTLHTEVSVTAKPFFQAVGFQVIEMQEHIVAGSPARRYIMQMEMKCEG